MKASWSKPCTGSFLRMRNETRGFEDTEAEEERGEKIKKSIISKNACTKALTFLHIVRENVNIKRNQFSLFTYGRDPVSEQRLGHNLAILQGQVPVQKIFKKSIAIFIFDSFIHFSLAFLECLKEQTFHFSVERQNTIIG